MSIWAQLAAPFAPEKVSWRVGSTTKDKKKGMMLAYISARDVMERLDMVIGPENWGDNYFETPKGRIICNLTIYWDGMNASITKSDGAGDTDVEGEKGGISDAFKRAAVKFGIGRYLYHLDSPWVELDEYKKMKKGQETKLLALLKAHTKEWARSESAPKPQKAPESRSKPSEPQEGKSPSQEPEAADSKPEPASRAQSKESVDEFVDRKEKELASRGEEPEPTGAAEGQQPWEKVRSAVPEWAPFEGDYFRGKKGGDPGFLDLVGGHKKRIGPRLYYKVLAGFKLPKATAIPKTNFKLQGKLLGYLKAMPDQDTTEGFAANAELILQAAKDTGDEVLIKSICEKMAEVGEKPTKKRCLQILDELEIIMGADAALNGGEDAE